MNAKDEFFTNYNLFFNKSFNTRDINKIFDKYGSDISILKFLNKINTNILKSIFIKMINGGKIGYYPNKTMKYTPKPLKNFRGEVNKYFYYNLRFYKYMYNDNNFITKKYDVFTDFRYGNIIYNYYFDILQKKFSNSISNEFNFLIKDSQPSLSSYCITEHLSHYNIDIISLIYKIVNNLESYQIDILKYVDTDKIEYHILKKCVKKSIINLQYIKNKDVKLRLMSELKKDLEYFQTDFNKIIFQKNLLVDILRDKRFKDLIKNLELGHDFYYHSLSYNDIKSLLSNTTNPDILKNMLKYKVYIENEDLLRFFDHFFKEMREEKDIFSYRKKCVNIFYIIKFKYYDYEFFKHFIKLAYKYKMYNILECIPLNQSIINFVIDNYFDKLNKCLRDVPIITDEERMLKIINTYPFLYENFLIPTNKVTLHACNKDIVNYKYISPELLDEKTIVKLKLTERKW